MLNNLLYLLSSALDSSFESFEFNESKESNQSNQSNAFSASLINEASHRSIRLYASSEMRRLGPEGLALLRYLDRNRLLSGEQREKIIHLVVHTDTSNQFDLGQLKRLILLTLCLDNQEPEHILWLDYLLTDQAKVLH